VTVDSDSVSRSMIRTLRLMRRWYCKSIFISEFSPKTTA